MSASVAIAAPAQAAPSTHYLLGKGLDSCTAPSLAQMSAFWNNTPYLYWGIYIGGSTRGCSQPNLTASWVRSVTTQGWKLLPIWVGPQNPCQPGQAAYFSRTTTTAYAQGKTEARRAYNALIALGLSANSPVDYDLESSGGTNTAACIAATRAFIDGWVDQLHVPPAQRAGVYGSTCASFLDKFATLSPPPDFIDGAAWDGNPSTSVLPCIPANHWVNRQRHKQYRGAHDETWHGVRLNVDSRCANSYVVANADFASSSTACR
jgi:Domain of unknown function (DUF1906)